jgi:DNA-binding FrmR family transcriptional regulator
MAGTAIRGYSATKPQQISAAQAALDQVALGLLHDHTRHCMTDGGDSTAEGDRTDEVIAAVSRLMRRG